MAVYLYALLEFLEIRGQTERAYLALLDEPPEEMLNMALRLRIKPRF